MEQNWILCNSEVLTALLIQKFVGMFARQQKASFILLCLSVYRTVCLQASAGFPPDGPT